MGPNRMNISSLASGIQELLRSKSAAGIEVVFKDNKAYTLHSTTLKMVKEDLEIVASETNIEAIADLSLDSMIPVNLVFNGKGIVHKLVEGEPETEDLILLQQVLPNAKMDDFYVDKVPATDGRYMVSILRKEQVDSIIAEFTLSGLYVVSMSFGPFVLQSIKTLLGSDVREQNSIHIAGHHLEYDGNKVIGYETEPNSNSQIEIGGEAMGEVSAIAFAAAFEYLFMKVDEKPTRALEIITAREEIKQRKIFQIGGVSVLGTFLFVLLANFMFFSSYSDTHAQLEGELFLSKDRIVYLSSLDQDVTSKSVLLKELGLLTPARTSFYADAIGSSVPKTLKLTGVFLNPLKKKVKVGENPVFNSGTIAITGRSNKSTTLNDWIKLLKQMDWVTQVKVIDYQSTGRSSSGEFELEIGID